MGLHQLQSFLFVCYFVKAKLAAFDSYLRIN